MNLLLDTNILIQLEPTRALKLPSITSQVSKLAQLAGLGRHTLYRHSATSWDIKRDRNASRQSAFLILTGKYPELPNPPDIPFEIRQALGNPRLHSNDWVDNALLAALWADSVDLLVTEDRRLLAKARRLGLSNRVITVVDALGVLESLLEVIPLPPPTVAATVAHTLDSKDPIFNSLKLDYPGFESWLAKCKREHRQTWVIHSETGELAGLSIVKQEQSQEYGLAGKLLKISTFKVSEQFSGNRYGELLLKAIFSYAKENKIDFLYLTIFEKHGVLINLLQEFGFEITDQKTPDHELVLAKQLSFTDEERNASSPLQFNIKFGPDAVKLTSVQIYIVPIEPRYVSVLFPESIPQRSMLPNAAPGNALRKAYISNAGVRSISPGDLLLFYRSHDVHSLICLGVCESSIISDSPDMITRYVSTRTVYKYEDIKRLCYRGNVLALLFRQVRILEPPVRLSELTGPGILKSAPQSITRLKIGLPEWLQHRLIA